MGKKTICERKREEALGRFDLVSNASLPRKRTKTTLVTDAIIYEMVNKKRCE